MSLLTSEKKVSALSLTSFVYCSFFFVLGQLWKKAEVRSKFKKGKESFVICLYRDEVFGMRDEKNKENAKVKSFPCKTQFCFFFWNVFPPLPIGPFAFLRLPVKKTTSNDVMMNVASF